MSVYRRFQLLTTALLVLSSMLSPFATLAQQATPVYEETPTPTEQTIVVPDVKPTDEVDDDPPATPSPTAPVTLTPLMRPSGLGVGLLSTGGPQVTVNGSTADAVLQSGTGVNIGIPDGAEAARFATGDCTGTPSPWAQATYTYVFFGGGVYSVQARSITDTSLVGPCVKIISVVAPNITFGGLLGPIYVLANNSVLTEFPGSSEWARFSDLACTVPATLWTNAVTSISEGEPTTAWFQARDVTYPQFRGTCVEVNWVNLPTMAINGSAGPLNLALGANAVPSFSPNSAWNTYAGAGCNPANTLQTGSTSTSPITSNSPVTRSYRVYFVPAPAFQGNCVTVTWRSATPTLTINGQTETAFVRNGVSVTPVIPVGAEWAVYTQADCQGSTPTAWYTSGPILGADGSTQSFRARWTDEHDALGNCVNVTWRADPPTPLLNGQSGPLVTQVWAWVTPSAPAGAEYAVFHTDGCGSDFVLGWRTVPSDFSYTVEGVLSIQARWAGDESSRGPCLSITFLDEAPITVNGSTGPLTLVNDTDAVPEFPEGAQWAMFSGADCTGDPLETWSTSTDGVAKSDGTWSFRARWGTNNTRQGNCVTVTWADPPTPLLNGQPYSLVTQPGTNVTPSVPAGAEYAVSQSAVCGDALVQGWRTTSLDFTNPTNGTYSAQARWIGDDNSTGPCLTITFADKAPMTVNGSPGPLTLANGSSAVPSFPEGAEWAMFSGGSCEGDPINSWSTSTGGVMNADGTRSFRARWGTNDGTQGNCATVNWTYPPTPLLYGQPNSQVIPLFTFITASAPAGAEYAVFRSDDCSGDIFLSWRTNASPFSSNIDDVLSIQARWADDPSALGPCLTVTFRANAPITVNGSTGPLTLLNGTTAVPAFPNGAQWAVFSGASCEGDPIIDWSPSTDGVAKSDGTWSFRARWGTNNTRQGNCVAVTWVDPPTPLLNGQPGPWVTQVWTWLTPSAPAGAEYAVFHTDGCGSDFVLGWRTVPSVFSKSAEGALSIQARWAGDESSKGPCLSITFLDEAPITVNGSTGPLTLVNDTDAVPEFPEGAQWAMFSGADCTGDPLETWSTSTDGVAKSDGTWSFRARWGTNNTRQGNCVAVTWRPATPSMTVNGSTGPLVLLNDTDAVPSFPDGAQWNLFSGTSCEGDPINDWSTTSEGVAKSDGTWSFQARWGTDDGTLGDCIAVTWADPPTVLLNDQPNSVVTRTVIYVATSAPVGAEYAIFLSMDCSGSSFVFDWRTSSSEFSFSTERVFSIQARWAGDDNSRGPCLTITFADKAPITINGANGPLTLVNGTSVVPGFPDDAQWAMFNGASCEGDPIGDWTTSTDGIAKSNGTWSFQARWVTDDGTQGNCIAVTWRPATPTLTVSGHTSAFTVPVGYQVYAVGSPHSEVAQFYKADCEGDVSVGWHEFSRVSPSVDGTISFVARWLNEDSTRGNCVTVTWAETPTLTVNGGINPLTILNGTSAIPAFPDGAQWNLFNGASCEGDPLETWSPLKDGVAKSDGTWSFQARLESDDIMRGNCVAVTWRPAPALTVSGRTSAFTVPVGYQVYAVGSPHSEVAQFYKADCEGDVSVGWHEFSRVSPSVDGTISFVARWLNEDSTRGNCVTVTWEPVSVPIFATAVCGNDNDVITAPKTQPGIDISDSGWSSNHRTITLMAIDGYTFPTNTQTVFEFTDDGPCVTKAPIMPAHAEICGIDNDTLTVPDQPANVLVSQSDAWSDTHTWTVTFSAAEHYVLPDGVKTEYVFTDEGPCVTGEPLPPVHAEICGTDNDTVTVEDQPANVLVSQSDAWSGTHTWTVTFTAAKDHVLPDDVKTEYVFTDVGPCLTDALVPPVQTAVCGIDNDTVTVSGQPENVLVDDTGWINGKRTVTFSAAEHYMLPAGTQTEYVFTDEGPCVTDAPLPPVHAEVCGIDNDTVSVSGQPANVLVTQSDAWSDTHTWTVTFTAAEHHVLPDDFQTEYVFTDAGPCVTGEPIPPMQAEVCGIDNDTVTYSGQPANVVVDDTGWIDGKRTVTFSAAAHHVLPSSTQTEYVFTDPGLCVTGEPIPPVQAEVCGIDNDTVTYSGQPANVVVDDTGWEDGKRTVTFSAAENYVLPDDTQTEYTFTDAGPCLTDAPLPPVQVAICGPDNDTVTLTQTAPQGISLESDTGWIDNARTIAYAIEPGYAVVGATTFALTDENDPCPPETYQAIVQLETSDGGSVEGAPYALYAPVASQLTDVTPYMEGTIGAGNQIVLNDLMPGSYRITINAVGYEPVDEVIVIKDIVGVQTIALRIQAMQVPTPEPTAASPTPEPTSVSPTSEPTLTPEPTASVATPGTTPQPTASIAPTDATTPQPTATTAVSGLPVTGAGGTGGFVWLAAGLFGLALMAVGVGMKRPQRKQLS